MNTPPLSELLKEAHLWTEAGGDLADMFYVRSGLLGLVLEIRVGRGWWIMGKTVSRCYLYSGCGSERLPDRFIEPVTSLARSVMSRNVRSECPETFKTPPAPRKRRAHMEPSMLSRGSSLLLKGFLD